MELSLLCSVLIEEAAPRHRCFLAARSSRGFTPTLLREPCRSKHLRRCTSEVRSVRPPFRSALYRRGWVQAPSAPHPATTASADFSLRRVQPTHRRAPFKAKARSPRVRTVTFPAQPPDLRRLSFGRESFAFTWTLALLGNASYPVSVRRLDGFATPLLSALPSRSAPCGSLRSLRPSSGRTFTSRPLFMPGTHEKRPASISGSGPLRGRPGRGAQTGTGRSMRKELRARFRRLFTVPTGMPISSAISS